MSNFYAKATDVLTEADGFVLEFIGDAVSAVFPPGFCGPHYARKAVQAAESLVHGDKFHFLDSTALEVGVGVNTGTVFIGTVSGTAGTHMGCAALGDNVNITSRLSEAAGPGEALISEICWSAAGCQSLGVKTRDLELKGKTKSTTVRVVSSQTPTLNFADNPSQALH